MPMAHRMYFHVSAVLGLWYSCGTGNATGALRSMLGAFSSLICVGTWPRSSSVAVVQKCADAVSGDVRSGLGAALLGCSIRLCTENAPKTLFPVGVVTVSGHASPSRIGKLPSRSISPLQCARVLLGCCILLRTLTGHKQRCAMQQSTGAANAIRESVSQPRSAVHLARILAA